MKYLVLVNSKNGFVGKYYFNNLYSARLECAGWFRELQYGGWRTQVRLFEFDQEWKEID